MIDWNWPSCWIKLGQLSANLPGGRAADIRSSYIASIFETSPAPSWRIIFCAASAVEEELSGASACGCPAGAGVCAEVENVANRKTSTTKTVLFNKESPCGCIFPRSKSIQETPFILREFGQRLYCTGVRVEEVSGEAWRATSSHPSSCRTKMFVASIRDSSK